MIKEENRLLMKKDKAFEQWWKVHFCDEQGKPLVFISIYKNTLDFKNYCKLAWEASKEARKEKVDELVEVILELVCFYSDKNNSKAYYSGGMPAMENAFRWLIRNGYAKGDNYRIELTDKAEKASK